jgi:membrane protease YdiL (CAAX protease family)
VEADSVQSGGGQQAPTRPQGALPLRQALSRFALEVLIVALLFGLLSLLAALAWGAWRGVQLAQHGMPNADAAAFTHALGKPGAIATVIMSLIGVGGTALVATLWRARPGPGACRHAQQALRSPTTWWLALFTSVAVICSSMIVSQIAAALQQSLDPTNMPLVRGTLARHPALLLLFAVVLAPIYEEMLFRRVLFGRLWRDGWPLLGAVFSAVLFAFMHEPPLVGDKALAAQLPLWLVYTCMGLAFAWVYRRTGSLVAPIIAHGLNNAFAIGIMLAAGPLH